MKYIFALLLTITGLKSYSQLEIYTYDHKGTITPDINVYLEVPVVNHLKLSSFSLIEQTWGESLIGLSYSPVDWFTANISGGIEHGQKRMRDAGFVWLGKGKWSLALLGEKGHGADNYWYKNTAQYQCTSNFSLGIRAWRYIGVGPVANLNFAKIKDSKVTAWIMPAYNYEEKIPELALGIDFQIQK